MAKCKVVFKVNADTEKVFLVGSTANLGEWNAAKAVELTKCEECGAFTTSKQFDADATVEFKVLAAKDWAAVEKGIWGEDLENHTFTVSKGLVVELGVSNFGK